VHLPPDFMFSQASLQDYVDCPRRFQYRHIEHRSWPAVVSEPMLEQERAMLQGAAFHRLVQQHLCGVPQEQLGSTVQGEMLGSWWSNYQAYSPANLPGTAYVEFSLSASLQSYRLVAKYDLIVHHPDGSLSILDWKTSRKRTRRETLAGHLQTRVYRSLLVSAGSRFNGGYPIEPECVRMIYWFAGYPADAEVFNYSRAQYQADAVYLTSLVDEIEGCSAGADFPSAVREAACQYCVYRSLCGRGVRAGDLSESETGSPEEPDRLFDLDFDLVTEIAF